MWAAPLYQTHRNRSGLTNWHKYLAWMPQLWIWFASWVSTSALFLMIHLHRSYKLWRLWPWRSPCHRTASKLLLCVKCNSQLKMCVWWKTSIWFPWTNWCELQHKSVSCLHVAYITGRVSGIPGIIPLWLRVRAYPWICKYGNILAQNIGIHKCLRSARKWSQ